MCRGARGALLKAACGRGGDAGYGMRGVAGTQLGRPQVTPGGPSQGAPQMEHGARRESPDTACSLIS